jgi:hypothetical protein
VEVLKEDIMNKLMCAGIIVTDGVAPLAAGALRQTMRGER